MKIIKPKKLQKGDTVAIISPSSAIPDELRINIFQLMRRQYYEKR